MYAHGQGSTVIADSALLRMHSRGATQPTRALLLLVDSAEADLRYCDLLCEPANGRVIEATGETTAGELVRTVWSAMLIYCSYTAHILRNKH